MPKKDGLVTLPDHVTAGLLRALMSIRRKPESRLLLQRSEYGRAPGYDQQNDYNVVWQGRWVGRIWRYDYPNHTWTGLGSWHWHRYEVCPASRTRQGTR
jgi:hypothetical protein